MSSRLLTRKMLTCQVDLGTASRPRVPAGNRGRRDGEIAAAARSRLCGRRERLCAGCWLGQDAKESSSFLPMPEQSLAAAVFQTLLDTLQLKASTLSSSGASHAAANGGISSARKNQVISSATFSLRVSFAELYEETITVRGSSKNVYLRDRAGC